MEDTEGSFEDFEDFHILRKKWFSINNFGEEEIRMML